MAPEPLHYLPITELAAGYRSRRFSPVEVTETYLSRIAQLNDLLGAYVSVTADEARAEARDAGDALLTGADRGPLLGVPLGLKDVIDVAGRPTMAGTSFRRDHRALRDAPVALGLRHAGAVFLGKHNMLEAALGGADRNPHFGLTPNPWNPAHFSGGSSSGTAVAVAAGLAAAGLGSDTGGSIRQPAAYCGITGLKPTHGLVSLVGIFPVAPSVDTVGPMTRSVADAAIVLQAIAQPPTSVDYLSALTPASLTTVRLGLDKSWVQESADGDVVAIWEQAARMLEARGVSLVDVTLPEPKDLGGLYRDLVSYEAFQTHRALLETHGPQYGSAARARLEEGRSVSPATYERSLQAKRSLARAVTELLARVDALLLPTQPTVAPLLGSQLARLNDSEMSVLPIRGRFTYLASLAGLPGLTVPAGFDRQGLPVGVQLVGRPFEEATLLRLGHALQQATDWHLRRPPLAALAGHPLPPGTPVGPVPPDPPGADALPGAG